MFSPHVAPGPAHDAHGAVEARHNVWPPARAVHRRLARVVEVVPTQLRPQHEDRFLLSVSTRVRLADEEEQSTRGSGDSGTPSPQNLSRRIQYPTRTT